ncbi:MAG: leucine--tRNA ligase [Alphaproteobacteria bacterium]|nr:leucine--tRNA ligase [Alphaproteobacteria bacterium]
MTKKYDFKAIEEKWQSVWEVEKTFDVKVDKSKKKYFSLVEFPYPSGAGLHVGHPRSFTAMDIISRKRRAEGYNVLFPMGFDAFGLPTERFAIKNHIHPAVATKQNVENFIKQLKSLGFSFNWGGMVNTTDPAYYKWTQWMFIQMFKAGLAYKGEETISWCPECKIGIANEELEAGHCERCGSEVQKKKKSAWILKMQSYSDKLLEGLNRVDFPESVKKMQTEWIGKSVGAEVDFSIKDNDEKLRVFTTRPDTIFGVSYMVIAPEHSLIEKFSSKIKNMDEVVLYQNEAKKKSEFERSQLSKEKTGVRLDGVVAINPLNGKEVPIFISDYVLVSYGTGAIMAVPAHDDRDWEFAKKFGLPIIPVIKSDIDVNEECALVDGEHINSDFLNGLNKEDAIKKAVEVIEEKGLGKASVKYRMMDWVFTRQRYWGEPIPMVNCPNCGWVPLDEKDLPLTLPDVDDYLPTDEGLSPLAKATDWVKTKCPKCGCDAERETDTMPTWAGSSWYYLRYMDPHNAGEFALKEALDYWGQVDWYEGGAEHVTRHLLYSRFWHKALFDMGLVPFDEPYKKRSLHGMILASNGEKMSKSKGNVINPDDIVKEYGADTLRVYEMFIGPFDQAAAWSTTSMIGIHRFLKKVYDLAQNVADTPMTEKDEMFLHQTIKDVSERIESMKFNTAVSALMVLSNYMNGLEKVPVSMMEVFAKLLNPFAPHLASEIWEILGHSSRIDFEPFPVFDVSKIKSSEVNIVITVNGKKRLEMSVPVDLSDEEVKTLVLDNNALKPYIEGKEIKKIIVVKNKIVNIVV